jgi:hypothetical protein
MLRPKPGRKRPDPAAGWALSPPWFSFELCSTPITNARTCSWKPRRVCIVYAGTRLALALAMDGARLVREASTLATLMLSLGWAGSAHAGKLSDMREETGSSSDNSSGSDDDDDDGNLVISLFGGDDDDCHHHYHGNSAVVDAQALDVTLRQPWFFPLYPYRGAVNGNLTRRHFTLLAPASTDCSRLDPTCHTTQQVVACVDGTCYSDAIIDNEPSAAATPPVAQVQSVRGQLQLDAGTTYDGLWRGTLSGAIDSHRGVGLETKLAYWVEPQAVESGDSTLLGDVAIRLALFTSPAFNLRIGAGPRFQVDEVSKAAGVNGSLGAEIYPFEPLVVRLDGDVGNLGKAVVYEAQASVGVLLMRTEILAGLSTLHIGDVAFDAAFAGIRFHL